MFFFKESQWWSDLDEGSKVTEWPACRWDPFRNQLLQYRHLLLFLQIKWSIDDFLTFKTEILTNFKLKKPTFQLNQPKCNPNFDLVFEFWLNQFWSWLMEYRWWWNRRRGRWRRRRRWPRRRWRPRRAGPCPRARSRSTCPACTWAWTPQKPCTVPPVNSKSNQIKSTLILSTESIKVTVYRCIRDQ